jgi:hypothetical protein
MKLPAALKNLTGHPRWAQRVEIATYSSALSLGKLSGLPWRMYTVVLPESPIPLTSVITAWR